VSGARTEYNRAYRAEHSEALKAKDRAYNAEHAQEKRDYASQYRQDHPELNEKLRRQQRARRAKRRAAVFAHYGESCACCGSTTRLSIDHVNGGGGAHRAELFGSPNLSGAHFYAWLVKNEFPEGYQTLCTPCNSSKRHLGSCQLDHSVEVS
jgi:hypothetical protein